MRELLVPSACCWVGYVHPVFLPSRQVADPLHLQPQGGDPVKSSYSGNLNCVDVTFVGGLVHVRNTREPELVHTFTVDEWEAFLLGVKAGEFDLTDQPPASDG